MQGTLDAFYATVVRICHAGYVVDGLVRVINVKDLNDGACNVRLYDAHAITCFLTIKIIGDFMIITTTPLNDRYYD